jgi:hypothetical protein
VIEKFDIGGTQISLNEAEAQGNQAAVTQINLFYKQNFTVKIE